MGLAFMLELAMFVALAYVGYKLSATFWVKIIFTITFPALAILAWAIFAAPKSEYRLDFPIRIVFELSLFLVTSLALYFNGKENYGIALLLVAMISESIAFYYRS